MAKLCRRVSITDSGNNELPSVLYLLKEDNDAYYLFVCNTGEDFRKNPDIMNDIMVRDRKIALNEVIIRGVPAWEKPAVEMDPETGALCAANVHQTSSGWEILTSLPALGSRLFLIPKKGCPEISVKPRPVLTESTRKRIEQNQWQYLLSENNVLALDRASFKTGNAQWQAENEILRIDGAVRDLLEIRRRGGAMVQPWARKKNKNPKKTRVSLSYCFPVNTIPCGNLFLAIEKPELYGISVNNNILSQDSESGWWTDRSLRKIPVDPSILRAGKNEIILETEYSENHPGLEIVYLLGNFGVEIHDNKPAMTALPASLKTGDWTGQGLPFYSGSVSYAATIKPGIQPGERLFVSVPEYRGVAVKVLVDGQQAGIIAWEPNEVDVTEAVTGRESVLLSIEVISHRRNSHGPFHYFEKWPLWTGPAEFVSEGNKWFEGYQLVPCGLMAEPELIVRRCK